MRVASALARSKSLRSTTIFAAFRLIARGLQGTPSNVMACLNFSISRACSHPRWLTAILTPSLKGGGYRVLGVEITQPERHAAKTAISIKICIGIKRSFHSFTHGACTVMYCGLLCEFKMAAFIRERTAIPVTSQRGFLRRTRQYWRCHFASLRGNSGVIIRDFS